MDAEAIAGHVAAIRKQGFTVIENVFDVAYIEALHGEFHEKYAQFTDPDWLAGNKSTLKVGSRRNLCSLALSGRFNDPLIFANPEILPLVRTILGADAILQFFGAVVSRPGAKEQPLHRDGPILFDGRIDWILPPHALAVIIPLVTMDLTHGSTRILPGSHLLKGGKSEESEAVTPIVAKGSCILWDFRVMHGGPPNVSDVVRPIVCLDYGRHWFRDSKNFIDGEQQRLVMDKDFLQGLAEDIRPLFSHVVSPDLRIERAT